MSRSRSTKSTEAPVENIDTRVEETQETGKEPVNLEVTASEEPETPAEAKPAEEIQTDVRVKLAKKSDREDVFVPANPVALEKAAAQVAQEQGFEMTRGTSIGARLIARAQKRV